MTIHPDTHLVEVTCAACGAVHPVRTTATTLTVETCSSCHPAYTGRERAAVGGSRIERFNRRLAQAV